LQMDCRWIADAIVLHDSCVRVCASTDQLCACFLPWCSYRDQKGAHLLAASWDFLQWYSECCRPIDWGASLDPLTGVRHWTLAPIHQCPPWSSSGAPWKSFSLHRSKGSGKQKKGDSFAVSSSELDRAISQRRFKLICSSHSKPARADDQQNNCSIPMSLHQTMNCQQGAIFSQSSCCWHTFATCLRTSFFSISWCPFVCICPFVCQVCSFRWCSTMSLWNTCDQLGLKQKMTMFSWSSTSESSRSAVSNTGSDFPHKEKWEQCRFKNWKQITKNHVVRKAKCLSISVRWKSQLNIVTACAGHQPKQFMTIFNCQLVLSLIANDCQRLQTVWTMQMIHMSLSFLVIPWNWIWLQQRNLKHGTDWILDFEHHNAWLTFQIVGPVTWGFLLEKFGHSKRRGCCQMCLHMHVAVPQVEIDSDKDATKKWFNLPKARPSWAFTISQC